MWPALLDVEIFWCDLCNDYGLISPVTETALSWALLGKEVEKLTARHFTEFTVYWAGVWMTTRKLEMPSHAWDRPLGTLLHATLQHTPTDLESRVLWKYLSKGTKSMFFSVLIFLFRDQSSEKVCHLLVLVFWMHFFQDPLSALSALGPVIELGQKCIPTRNIASHFTIQKTFSPDIFSAYFVFNLWGKMSHKIFQFKFLGAGQK